MNVRNKVKVSLSTYLGGTHIHLVTQDPWGNYPLWRRESEIGRADRTINDSTIRIEMSIRAAIMRFQVGKRYVLASHRFEGMLKLKTNRRCAVMNMSRFDAAQLSV